MTIRNVVQVTKAAQYDGTNASEIIEAANSSGLGPFVVIQEGGAQVTIGLGTTGWFTLAVGEAMVGINVVPQPLWETQYAAVTLIGEED